LTDLSWRGYDPRAAVPQLAVAAAASAALLSGRWYLEELSELADRAGALAVYALVLAVWPGLLAVVLYRTVTFTYRLTDRALLLDRGSLFRPEPPVWLADVTAVTAGASWLGRRLGVGWVRVATDGRTVRLTGVRDPGAFAVAVRAAVETAREGKAGGAPVA
jgi:uncharacterized membrane protein YdbT with pleckstrin-like domain